MKQNITRILFGISALFFAVLILGNLVSWWKINDFDGWWSVFLIVPGISGIISEKFNLWYVLLTLGGVWLLAKNQGWLKNVNPLLYLFIALVILGLWLILKPIFDKKSGNDGQ